MADLLKAASEIFNKGFDVENDPVSDFEPINDLNIRNLVQEPKHCNLK